MELEAKGWLGAAGGLWATGPDLARWDLALMGGPGAQARRRSAS